MSTSRLYASDIRAIPRLSAEEQDALARRFARERDPRDAQRLVLANLGLVIALAKSLGGTRRADWMDLVPDVAAEARDDLERVRAVERLEQTSSARERVILRSRLLSDSPKGLRQVGTKLALSGERVRQLERGMLGRLRTLVESAA